MEKHRKNRYATPGKILPSKKQETFIVADLPVRDFDLGGMINKFSGLELKSVKAKRNSMMSGARPYMFSTQD